MIAALVLAGLAVADGPDLSAVDVAVGKCDSRAMSRTFGDEPARRRAFAIAAFNEQKAIVDARATLAARRLAAPVTPALVPSEAAAGALMPTPVPELVLIARESETLAERQRALDDARTLEAMRDQTLDMMRAQYLSRCSGGRNSAQD